MKTWYMVVQNILKKEIQQKNQLHNYKKKS